MYSTMYIVYMQYRIKILSTQCEKGTVIVSSTLVYEYTKIGLGVEEGEGMGTKNIRRIEL